MNSKNVEFVPTSSSVLSAEVQVGHPRVFALTRKAFIGHEPSRGSGQEAFKISLGGVRPGREMLQIPRVGSGSFHTSRIGLGRVTLNLPDPPGKIHDQGYGALIFPAALLLIARAAPTSDMCCGRSVFANDKHHASLHFFFQFVTVLGKDYTLSSRLETIAQAGVVNGGVEKHRHRRTTA